MDLDDATTLGSEKAHGMAFARQDGLHPPRILKLNRKRQRLFDGPRYVMSILQAQDAPIYVYTRIYIYIFFLMYIYMPRCVLVPQGQDPCKLTAGGGHYWGSSMPFARQTGMLQQRHAGRSLFDLNSYCAAGFNGCSVSFHAKGAGWSLSHFRACLFDGSRHFSGPEACRSDCPWRYWSQSSNAVMHLETKEVIFCTPAYTLASSFQPYARYHATSLAKHGH